MKIPQGYRPAGKRALIRPVDLGGKAVLAVAPCPEDLVVSKLARLDPKDKEFIETYHAARPLDLNTIEQRVRATGFERPIEERALTYVESLKRPRE
jgi:hypothetical protein